MEKFYQYLWQPDALTQTESRQRRRLEARQCRPLLDQPRCSYIIRARRGRRRYGKSRSGALSRMSPLPLASPLQKEKLTKDHAECFSVFTFKYWQSDVFLL